MIDINRIRENRDVLKAQRALGNTKTKVSISFALDLIEEHLKLRAELATIKLNVSQHVNPFDQMFGGK